MAAANDQRHVFVIFGGGGGIGSALAGRLVRNGHRVVAAGRTPEKLQKLQDELDIETSTVDAGDFEQAENCLSETMSRHGRIDGVVNCVGSLLLKPAHITAREQWDEAINTNLTTAFAVVRGAANVMRRTGGSVVLMASAAARYGLPNHEAIAAAKAGVIGLMLSASASYAKSNLRFNALAPGLVRTPLTERIWGNESTAQASQSLHALQRFGEPDEVAAMIEWLLLPDSGWITGQVFGIDGGLATVQPGR